MSWRFNTMNRGDMNTDPHEGEFFATETLGSIVDASVREAIQNSLDAAAGERIRVRFRLGQAPHQARHRYLRELWPHVEAAAQETSQSLPDRASPLRYLVVEHERTRGLEGDPGQYEDDAGEESRNDFYYFWRNVGRSRKQNTFISNPTVIRAARFLYWDPRTQRPKPGAQDPRGDPARAVASSMSSSSSISTTTCTA
jgi:hypothetical protein